MSKEDRYISRAEKLYKDSAKDKIAKEFDVKNVHRIPKLDKIVVNVGMGSAIENSKHLDAAVEELTLITGQRAVVTRAKKAISNFKLRKGMAIGCKVTLRGSKMYDFFDRLVNVAIPRIRDFRGVSTRSFDGRGNYTVGIKEQIIFPEIDYDKIERIHGMDITIVTTAESDDEAYALLREMGMPFVQRTSPSRAGAEEPVEVPA